MRERLSNGELGLDFYGLRSKLTELGVSGMSIDGIAADGTSSQGTEDCRCWTVMRSETSCLFTPHIGPGARSAPEDAVQPAKGTDWLVERIAQAQHELVDVARLVDGRSLPTSGRSLISSLFTTVEVIGSPGPVRPPPGSSGSGAGGWW